MELRDVRTFVAVVDLASFTNAGRHLHIVQSAVSQAVSRLEKELGVQLLERRPGPVKPTAAGEAFWRHAQLSLNAIRRAEEEMAAFRGLSKGRIHLGLPPSVTPFLLLPLLRRLHQTHPGIQLHTHEGIVEQMLERLRLGELDLTIVVLPVQASDLVLEPLLESRLGLVVGTDHPLWRVDEVDMTELREESWVTFPRSNPGRQWLERLSLAASFLPRITAEVTSLGEMIAFVQAGYGICLMPPESFAEQCKAGSLHSLSLKPRAPHYAIGLVSDPHHPSGAFAVVHDTVVEIAKQMRTAR